MVCNWKWEDIIDSFIAHNKGPDTWRGCTCTRLHVTAWKMYQLYTARCGQPRLKKLPGDTSHVKIRVLIWICSGHPIEMKFGGKLKLTKLGKVNEAHPHSYHGKIFISGGSTHLVWADDSSVRKAYRFKPSPKPSKAQVSTVPVYGRMLRTHTHTHTHTHTVTHADKLMKKADDRISDMLWCLKNPLKGF